MIRLYVIASDAGLVKIGSSRAPANRLPRIRCQRPGEVLTLTFVSGPIGGRALALEWNVHAALKEHRLDGEWFAVTPEEAAEAIRAEIRRIKASDKAFRASLRQLLQSEMYAHRKLAVIEDPTLIEELRKCGTSRS